MIKARPSSSTCANVRPVAGSPAAGIGVGVRDGLKTAVAVYAGVKVKTSGCVGNKAAVGELPGSAVADAWMASVSVGAGSVLVAVDKLRAVAWMVEVETGVCEGVLITRGVHVNVAVKVGALVEKRVGLMTAVQLGESVFVRVMVRVGACVLVMLGVKLGLAVLVNVGV
jgi:hypothetical protein